MLACCMLPMSLVRYCPLYCPTYDSDESDGTRRNIAKLSIFHGHENSTRLRQKSSPTASPRTPRPSQRARLRSLRHRASSCSRAGAKPSPKMQVGRLALTCRSLPLTPHAATHQRVACAPASSSRGGTSSDRHNGSSHAQQLRLSRRASTAQMLIIRGGICLTMHAALPWMARALRTVAGCRADLTGLCVLLAELEPGTGEQGPSPSQMTRLLQRKRRNCGQGQRRRAISSQRRWEGRR